MIIFNVCELHWIITFIVVQVLGFKVETKVP